MIKLNKLYADYDEKSDDFILTTEKKEWIILNMQ